MASPAVTALRAELISARGPLMLQIRGLTDLMSMPGLSAEAMAVLEAELTEHQARRTALDQVLMGLDALDANGYPASMASDVPASIRDELLEREAAIEAALGELRAAAEAAAALITFGVPEDK